MKQIRRLTTYPEEMFKRLLAESARTGLAVTEIVRRAIDAYFAAKK